MMLFGDRPTNGRAAFETDAAEYVTVLTSMINADGSPDHDAINAYVKSNEICGGVDAVKPHFMQAQHRKCGYCEVKLTESTGDVEHYRPKNAVWSLKSRGQELDDLVNIRGRSYYKTWDSGYWWLAYSWDNYLVACPNCNQKWKNALFPISTRRRREPRPGDELSETPLLLNPFGDRNPAEHLSFDVLGQIEPYAGSRIGRKTIETCGLDRESIRSSRVEKARRAHHLVRRLSSSNDDSTTAEILNDFEELGNSEYAHSGMVRAIFEQETGMSWGILNSDPPPVGPD